MDLYTKLKLQPIRKEPDVWVRRLAIFEQINPEPKVIRNVSLTKGLNIVWAEEPEDDNSNAEIAGHSAGKTTFCRLLRYVLGEKTYSTKANTGLISQSLPDAYVGAEIFVQQRLWAVIRPIGNGRTSYIKPNATIEELLTDRTHRAYLDTYPKEIGLIALLHDLEPSSIVSTGEPIEWGHVLAWCSRDQEARFQNNHDWRSPRSESDWPNFDFPKSDPIFVMRCILGLLLPDELKGEQELATLLHDKERLDNRIAELKREPQYLINLYDADLRQRLREVLKDEPDIETLPLHWDKLPPDLHRLAEKAVQQMEADLASSTTEAKKVQDQIDEVGARIKQRETRLRTIANLFHLEGGAVREVESGISQMEKARDLFDEYGEEMCILGGILYQDCDHVQERQQTFLITQRQDANALEEAKRNRAKIQRDVEEQKGRLSGEIDDLTNERLSLQSTRDRLLSAVSAVQEGLRDLRLAKQNLEIWTVRQTEPAEFRELVERQAELEMTVNGIETTKKQLGALLERHAHNRNLLASIFSGAVKGVLTAGTYDGRVSIHNRELAFQILHGPAMSGEGMGTLSVLLADVSCLIYNSVSKNVHLPGILLHDSPREADLGLRLYRSFIRFVASLEQHFGRQDACPFQYIITTTTPPPEELRTPEHVRLRLDASRSDGLLLGRSFGATGDDSPLLF